MYHNIVCSDLLSFSNAEVGLVSVNDAHQKQILCEFYDIKRINNI